MEILHLGSSEKKNSEADLNKIEARFGEWQQKMNSLKIKLEKCLNIKEKLNNMEQLQMEYLDMGFEKVKKFNFLNEEVDEFMSRWSRSLVNVRSPSYLKQKNI